MVLDDVGRMMDRKLQHHQGNSGLYGLGFHLRLWGVVLLVSCGSIGVRAAVFSNDVIPLRFEPFRMPGGYCMMLWLRGHPGQYYQIESAPLQMGRGIWRPWEALEGGPWQNGPVLCLDFGQYRVHRRQYRAVRLPPPEEPVLGNLPPATEMIWIEPGTFVMGSPETEKDRDPDEGPLTLVTLTKPYALGVHEVTQAQYVAVMEHNPSRHKFNRLFPVTNVRWEAAVEYCRRLTVLERIAGLIKPNQAYRLPTEAEWEYACRAGSSTRFPYGDDEDHLLLGAFAWYGANSGVSTQPVLTRLPNPWGLHGMLGNVHEWCADRYQGLLDGGHVFDPKGPRGGTQHVIRGGSWMEEPRNCRIADRHRDWFKVYVGNVGFRIALSEETEE